MALICLSCVQSLSLTLTLFLSLSPPRSCTYASLALFLFLSFFLSSDSTFRLLLSLTLAHDLAPFRSFASSLIFLSCMLSIPFHAVVSLFLSVSLSLSLSQRAGGELAGWSEALRRKALAKRRSPSHINCIINIAPIIPSSPTGFTVF